MHAMYKKEGDESLEPLTWIPKIEEQMTVSIDISEDIDTFTPDPELEAKLMHERQTLIKKLALDISGEYGLLE